jgi:ribosomal protein S27AE
MDTHTHDRCPRCGEGRLKSWHELSEEERMIARRLPSHGYTLSEREARHRWCPRCWSEETQGESREA